MTIDKRISLADHLTVVAMGQALYALVGLGGFPIVVQIKRLLILIVGKGDGGGQVGVGAGQAEGVVVC